MVNVMCVTSHSMCASVPHSYGHFDGGASGLPGATTRDERGFVDGISMTRRRTADFGELLVAVEVHYVLDGLLCTIAHATSQPLDRKFGV